MPNGHPATYQNKHYSPLRSKQTCNATHGENEGALGATPPATQSFEAESRRKPLETTMRRDEKPSYFKYMQPTRDHWWKKTRARDRNINCSNSGPEKRSNLNNNHAPH
ncbi:hypothetical protein Bca4012_098833 [Brassica carinata]